MCIIIITYVCQSKINETRERSSKEEAAAVVCETRGKVVFITSGFCASGVVAHAQ